MSDPADKIKSLKYSTTILEMTWGDDADYEHMYEDRLMHRMEDAFKFVSKHFKKGKVHFLRNFNAPDTIKHYTNVVSVTAHFETKEDFTKWQMLNPKF